MFRKIWILGIAIIAMFCAAALATAGGINETFDDVAIFGWERSAGVTVSDGILTVPDGGFASHDGDWSEFTLTAFLRLSGEGEFVLGYGGGGYRLVVGPEYLVLNRYVAGNEEEMGSAAPVAVPWGEWFTLTVQVTGGRHTVQVDGIPLIRADDPSPLSGGISIEALGGKVEVDTLALVPGGAAPTEGNAVAPSAQARVAPAVGVPPGPPIAPAVSGLTYVAVDGEELKLDIYEPAGAGTYPVVIYIHGGGFTACDRLEGQHWASYLVPWGYAVVSIDYRLAPQHRFPAAIADVQCAIAWVREHASEYGLDADRIALVGSSAGGNLALLAGLSAAQGAPAPTWEPSCGAGDDLRVQAVVSHSAPTDLAKIVSTPEGAEAVRAFLGSLCADAELCAQASPITYVTPDAPPVLLFHGTDDNIVPVINARSLASELKEVGAEVTYVEMKGAGHVEPLGEAQFETLHRFLDAHLGRSGSSEGAGVQTGSETAVGTYSYDFEAGTAGWELSEAWSRVETSDGYALQGTGEGSAGLSAVTGRISYLKYRFMVDELGGGLNANIFTPSMRYTLEVGARGLCFFTLAPDQELEHCIFGHYPILPGWFYTVEMYLSDTSVDVFINGEGVVGTELASPPGEERVVGFEVFAGGGGSVTVDDVEVKLGDLRPPSRARSPYSWKAGKDAGPFTNGISENNFTLEGNEALTLQGGRYLSYGDITLRDNASLIIEADAALYISDIFLYDSATLIMKGGYLLPLGSILQPGDEVNKTPPDMLGAVYAVDSSTVTIENAKLGIHFIDANGNARLVIKKTRFYTGGGGMITPYGSSTIDVEDSTLGAITLVIPAGATFKANGLKPGHYDDLDLQRDMDISGVSYNLTLKNVDMVPDTLSTGYASDASERGWELEVTEGAQVELTDSELRKLTFQIPGGGPPLTFQDLKVGHPMNATVGPVKLINTTVRGQWGFYIHGDRQVTIADSDGVWPLPYDTSQLTIKNTRINEFDPREYTGTLTFEDSRWYGPGEIIMDCDFLLRGTLDMKVTTLAWIGSTVTREYPIRVLDLSGNPLAGEKITLKRGDEVVTAITDSQGEALVRLKFTDEDYREKWTLTTDRGHSVEIGFFTSTPVILR